MRAALLLLLPACAAGAATNANATAPKPEPLAAAASVSAPPAPAAAPPPQTERATTPAPAPPLAPEPEMVPVGPVPVGGSVLVGDIDAPPRFAPKPVLVKASDRLVACFNQARSYEPSLHGKLVLRLVVNEAGKILSIDADTRGNAYHPKLVECLNGAFKATTTFAKPAGTATISAPLVFRP